MKGPKACFQCLRMQEIASTISKFSGGAWPQTPLVGSFVTLSRRARKHARKTLSLNQFLKLGSIVKTLLLTLKMIFIPGGGSHCCCSFNLIQREETQKTVGLITPGHSRTPQDTPRHPRTPSCTVINMLLFF